MWIKICGLTTEAAVEAAVRAKVDAIGFVFAEAKRRVPPQTEAELADPARVKLRCIAVTKHPEQRDIDDILATFRPDVLQTDVNDLPRLSVPGTLELLPVVRAGSPEPKQLPKPLLFEGPVSGVG